MTGRLLLCLGLALAVLCSCAPAAPAPEPQPETAQPSARALARAEMLKKSERELLDDLAFGRVKESKPVDAAWFDDAVFIGDSVSVMLEYYNNACHPLGEAAFLCVESLNPRNAMNAEPGSPRLPEWPKGSGERPALPDSVADSGRGKVYLMLGINSISGGVDKATADLVQLVALIQKAAPDTVILIQSVTPMMKDSPRTDEALNNDTIRAYDLALADICREKGWYYIDISQALADEEGFLRTDYSGDKAMGIHLNFKGTEAWADYLLTHVPADLK